MIQVKNMTFSYNGQDEAIKNVSFSIEKGHFCFYCLVIMVVVNQHSLNYWLAY